MEKKRDKRSLRVNKREQREGIHLKSEMRTRGEEVLQSLTGSKPINTTVQILQAKVLHLKCNLSKCTIALASVCTLSSKGNSTHYAE